MKFVEKNPLHKIKFEDIPSGRLFKATNEVYIALDESADLQITEQGQKINTEHYAVNLETGELVYFSYADMVTPIDGTLTYERI